MHILDLVTDHPPHCRYFPLINSKLTNDIQHDYWYIEERREGWQLFHPGDGGGDGADQRKKNVTYSHNVACLIISYIRRNK